MNADDVNKWLTLCANIGVVIGLVLLLVELDQNSDLVRAQIHQSMSDNWVTSRLAFADSEFLLPAFEKLQGTDGIIDATAMDALDPVEAERVYRYLTAFIGDYDNLFYQYQQGYLDYEYYEYRVVPSIKQLAPLWSDLEIFERSRPSFKAEVERLAAGN